MVVTYRGVPAEKAITESSFESVWALLVDGEVGSPLPPAEEFPLPIRTGDHRVDLQSALAGLAPVWGFTSLLDTSAEEVRTSLARASVMALSFLAQSARGPELPSIPGHVVNQVHGAARRFLMRWTGEVDAARSRAIDAAWIALAADPQCPSTRVAAVTAGAGADVAACLSAAVAACSGPLTSGGTAHLSALLRTDPAGTAAAQFRRRWGFVAAPRPVADARAEALEQVARTLGTRYDDAAEHARILARHTHPRFPMGQLLTTLWVTHLFTFAGVPDRMLTAMIACGKTAGWSATIAAARARLQERMTP